MQRSVPAETGMKSRRESDKLHDFRRHMHKNRSLLFLSETILRVQTISWKETSQLNDHAVVELDEQKYQNQAKTTFAVMKSNILPLIFVFFFFLVAIFCFGFYILIRRRSD